MADPQRIGNRSRGYRQGHNLNPFACGKVKRRGATSEELARYHNTTKNLINNLL